MIIDMSKYEYYPIACKLSEQTYYLIYCSGDIDFVASKDGCHIAFKDINTLTEYVNQNNMDIFHIDQCAEYDFEFLQSFSSKQVKSIENPKEMMDCWNLLDDISENNQTKWGAFIESSGDLRKLHEKLLFDSNIFTDENIAPQKWSNSEISKLQTLFATGLKLFFDHMFFYD